MNSSDWLENKSDIERNKKIIIFDTIITFLVLISFFLIFYIYYIREAFFLIISIAILISLAIVMTIVYKSSMKSSITKVLVSDDGIEFSSEKSTKKVLWVDYGENPNDPYVIILSQINKHQKQNRIDESIAEKIRNSNFNYHANKLETKK